MTRLPRDWVTWVAVTAPTLLGLILAHSSSAERTASDAAAVACQLTMLAVAVGFAAHQHECDNLVSGWLSAAVALPPVAVALTGMVETVRPGTSTPAGAAVLYLGGAFISLTWILVAGSGRSAPRTPIVLGFVGGATSAAGAVTVSLAAPSATLHTPSEVAVLAVAALCFVVLGGRALVVVTRRADLGRWITTPLCAGGATLALGAAASTWLPTTGTANVAAGTFHLLAWGCFLTVAVRLLALVTRHRNRVRLAASARLHRRNEDLRQAQATIHEVRATVAGLASATRLLGDPSGLPSDARRRLVEMRGAEIARIERLLADGAPRVSRVADLGDTLLPVVELLRASGHSVVLRAGPGHTHEAPDEVAQIVHVLLDNAARHGSGPIEVDLDRRSSHVSITVTDAGPGVPPELRDRMFDWGVSGAGSSGIGLHDARARATALGGGLRLAHAGGGCTRFELVLPAVPEEVLA